MGFPSPRRRTWMPCDQCHAVNAMCYFVSHLILCKGTELFAEGKEKGWLCILNTTFPRSIPLDIFSFKHYNFLKRKNSSCLWVMRGFLLSPSLGIKTEFFSSPNILSDFSSDESPQLLIPLKCTLWLGNACQCHQGEIHAFAAEWRIDEAKAWAVFCSMN